MGDEHSSSLEGDCVLFLQMRIVGVLNSETLCSARNTVGIGSCCWNCPFRVSSLLACGVRA